MIATQRIKSTTDKPIALDDYETINVLKWKNSRWKNLSPYLLTTDGNEQNTNNGDILFENFWQGCKVFDVVYENKVYASRYHINKPEHLWWDFVPNNPNGDVVYDGEINMNNYLNWRNSLWNCENPIRYPNKIHRRVNTQFALTIDKKGKQKRYDYIQARKNIYYKEYIRLVKKTPQYEMLLDKLVNGENIMICEVDVPCKGKKGNYDCDSNICHMTIEKLELLLNDPEEAFGHGLCLALSLLRDLAL